MQLLLFACSKRAGDASRILASDGIHSPAKSLPAATGVYSFSLFQVLTMLNFLLNFIRFSSVFRKDTRLLRLRGVCATSVSVSKFILLPFPLRVLTVILFSFPSNVEKRHMNVPFMNIHFPCTVWGSKTVNVFILWVCPLFYSNIFYWERGDSFDMYY